MKIKNIAEVFIQTFLQVMNIDIKRMKTKMKNKQPWIDDLR